MNFLLNPNFHGILDLTAEFINCPKSLSISKEYEKNAVCS